MGDESPCGGLGQGEQQDSQLPDQDPTAPLSNVSDQAHSPKAEDDDESPCGGLGQGEQQDPQLPDQD